MHVGSRRTFCSLLGWLGRLDAPEVADVGRYGDAQALDVVGTEQRRGGPGVDLPSR